MSHKELKVLLGLDNKDFSLLTSSNNNYECFDITTTNGKIRSIQHPKTKPKKVHSRVADLLSRIDPGSFLQCPVKGRSYITNAAIHTDFDETTSLDIKDYFLSTRATAVHSFFHFKMECTPDIAYTLMSLLTSNGVLPTGSPVSPILSFFAHWRMFEEIDDTIRNCGCVWSIYVDDIHISGSLLPKAILWK